MAAYAVMLFALFTMSLTSARGHSGVRRNRKVGRQGQPWLLSSPEATVKVEILWVTSFPIFGVGVALIVVQLRDLMPILQDRKVALLAECRVRN